MYIQGVGLPFSAPLSMRTCLEQYVGTHGLSMRYDWLLVFPLPIPAVQLHASEKTHTGLSLHPEQRHLVVKLSRQKRHQVTDGFCRSLSRVVPKSRLLAYGPGLPNTPAGVRTRSAPASRQEHLSVHLHGGLAPELASGQVGVVGGADEVVGQRLIHILVQVEAVEKDRRVLVRHEVPAEAVTRHAACRGQQGEAAASAIGNV